MIQNMSPLEKTSAGVGGSTAFIGGLALSEIALWVGIAATVLTFVAAQYWQWRRDRREELRLAHDLGEEEERRESDVPVAKERRT